MPGQDTYIQLPDNSYVHVPGDTPPDQMDALRAKLSSGYAAGKAAVAPDNPFTAPLSKATAIERAPSLREKLAAGSVPGLDEFQQGRETVGTGKGLPPQPTFAGRLGQTVGMLTNNPATQAIVGTISPEAAEATAGTASNLVERAAGVPEAQAEGRAARTALQAENTTAREGWQNAVEKSKQLAGRARSLSDARADLNSRLDQATNDLGQHVVDVHKNVRAGLDARWDSLRRDIGSDSPISLQPLAAGSKTANSAVTDVNRSLYKSIVNDVLGDVNLKDEGLSWRNAQAAYTKLGERMYGGGELPGDVYRALKQFRAGLSDAMEETASAKGLKGEYQSLKADHSAYESTFHDARSVGARGGSPVAASLRAADPANKAAPLTGNAADRAKELIGQYATQGGDPSRIDDVLALKNQLAKMPKDISVPEPPNRPLVKTDVEAGIKTPQEIRSQRVHMARNKATKGAAVAAGAGTVGAIISRLIQMSRQSSSQDWGQR